MKISKFILLAIFGLSLFTCSSDDSSNDTQAITKIIPSASIGDVNAILALPADSDITNLISFGQPDGVSTADYESIVEINDRFILERPAGLLPGDKFIYDNIFFYDEIDEPIEYEGIIDQYLKLIIPSGESNDYYDNYPTTIIFKTIDADADFDLNWKYDIICYIERDAVLYGPFTIDPKLRVKRKTTLDN